MQTLGYSSGILVMNGVPQADKPISVTNQPIINTDKNTSGNSTGAGFKVTHTANNYELTQDGQSLPKPSSSESFTEQPDPEMDEAVNKAVYGKLLNR